MVVVDESCSLTHQSYRTFMQPSSYVSSQLVCFQLLMYKYQNDGHEYGKGFDRLTEAQMQSACCCSSCVILVVKIFVRISSHHFH